jgi:hypothetical protein
MTFSRSIKRGAAAVACLVAVLGAAAPAVGAHRSSVADAATTWTDDDHKLYVSDTKNDDNDVYGQMTRQGVSGTPKLRNSNGNGSTVYRTYGATILSLRACVDDAFGDTCDSWR